MGFRSGAYAKVWSCSKGNGNYYVADMSTSRKTQDGGYENDWSNKFVRLVGEAAEQAESINDGDSVRIGSCDVTNHYDKAKQTLYTNYVIFSFMNDDDDNGSGNTQRNSAKKTTSSKSSTKGSNAKKVVEASDDDYVNIPDGIDEELPFT